MALQALHGHLTDFYWGQGYGGPQEALLTVPLFWLFGDELGGAAHRPDPDQRRRLPRRVAGRAAPVGRAGGRRRGCAALGVAAVPAVQAHPPVRLLRERLPLLHASCSCSRCASIERPDRTRVGTFASSPASRSGRPCRSSRSLAVVVVWTVWRRAARAPPLPVALGLAAARRAAVDRLEHRARRRLVRDPLRPVPVPAPAAALLLADPADDARAARAVLRSRGCRRLPRAAAAPAARRPLRLRRLARAPHERRRALRDRARVPVPLRALAAHVGLGRAAVHGDPLAGAGAARRPARHRLPARRCSSCSPAAPSRSSSSTA